jgi:hypothetical protein
MTPSTALPGLYLDLLKRALTNTIFVPEPNPDDDEFRFTFLRKVHYVDSSAVSMLPLVRFDNLQQLIIDVIAQNIPGDLIETGAWRGGATIFMRAVLKVYGIADRVVWAADSFEGLPEPDAEKYPVEAKAWSGCLMQRGYQNLVADLEQVKRNFAAYGMLDDQTRFLKGWFSDTLPSAPIERLAILRLDGDFYKSTMDSLNALYDRLSEGGYVIIDGEDSWTYCRRAVDEFRAQRNITDPMVAVDSKCCYWRKS